MGVISTNKWLTVYEKRGQESSQKKMDFHFKLFGEKLSSYFKDATPQEVHQYLLQNGLFEPTNQDEFLIKRLIETDLWDLVREEYKQLRYKWKGPDVPIFIFPANLKRSMIRNELGGKSGVSFGDKLFLFVSPELSKKEVLALLTHEYHHVCRLQYQEEEESKLTIMDSVIIEGMAENAVEQTIGKDYLSAASTIYLRKQALLFFKKFIKPNAHVTKDEKQHIDLLYGKGMYPKWLGYCAGYHIVNIFIEEYNKDIAEITALPTKEIYGKLAKYIGDL